MKSFSGSVILIFVLVFSISFFEAGVYAAGKKEKISPSRNTAAAQEPAGKEAGLYNAKCAACHGALGEGSAKIAKMLKLDEAQLKLAGSKASDADLLKALLDGKAKMPGFKGKISDDEAKGLIKYIRTFKK